MPTFQTKLKHKPDTVIEVFGEFFTFTAGVGLLTTDTPRVIERLRAIPEGFIELDAQPEPEQVPVIAPPVEDPPLPPADDGTSTDQMPASTDTGPVEDAPIVSPFVLKNGAGEALDLATLDDDQLRAFVVENGLKVNGRTKGDTLRTAIVQALKPAA